MLRKVFVLSIAFAIIQSFNQTILAQGVGEFNDTVSTKLYKPLNKEWVKFNLIDSVGTADTIVVEEYNPWANQWSPLIVRDDSSGAIDAVVLTSVSGHGNLFTVWTPYPQLLRFRRTDVHALSNKVYIYISTRGQ